jgi:hypothetical protein
MRQKWSTPFMNKLDLNLWKGFYRPAPLKRTQKKLRLPIHRNL